MPDIQLLDDLQKLTQDNDAKLIAVSKTRTIEEIEAVYKCDQRLFGENKIQELEKKVDLLPKDIEWHMIGHLQTNKVKYIAPYITMIHAVDSLKLAKEINKQAKKHNRIIDVLLQIHIAKEESKYGFNFEELIELFQQDAFEKLDSINICGLMGMASFVDDASVIKKEFKKLRQHFAELKANYFDKDDAFKEISMGMSWRLSNCLSRGKHHDTCG